MDKHGIEYKRNNRTEDQIGEAIARYGSLDDVRAVLLSLRKQGLGWQRIAEFVGLNRYACKVLVEEGRVPGLTSCLADPAPNTVMRQ